MNYIMRRVRNRLLAFQRNYQLPSVEVNCATEFVGSPYGGWNICPAYISADSIVYSAGIGLDISFDTSMVDRFGVTVHAFDPTPATATWLSQQQLPAQFRFHPVGLANFDGETKFYLPQDSRHISHSIIQQSYVGAASIDVPMQRITTIMNLLKHTEIDLLKMDIEGAEYAVLNDILELGVTVKQILVEFHDRFMPSGIDQTKDILQRLRTKDYKVFAVSKSKNEYSLINAAVLKL